MLRQAARLLCSIFAHAPVEHRPKLHTFRPRVEVLEGRDVPTPIYWKGGGSFTDVNSWWSSQLPQAGDDIIFWDAAYSADCPNMQGPSGGGAWRSVTLVSTYNGTVTLAAGFQTEALIVNSGTINQGAGMDITVGGTSYIYNDDPDGATFKWTVGTINNTLYLANLILTGSETVGIIDPGGGTVGLGSNLTMQNGANVTMKAGEIDVNKSGVQFTTSTGSRFAINPGTLGQAIIGVLQPGVPLDGVIMPTTSWTVYAGTFSYGGPIGNAGTLTLMPGVSVFLTGDPSIHEGYVQWGDNSATYLHGFSNLAVSEPVQIQGGILATVWSDYYETGHATITSPSVEVSGGDIYVNYGQAHYHFDELIIDGNLLWSGGTFHPYVLRGGLGNDVWRQSCANDRNATFTITGGTIAPIPLDQDYAVMGVPDSGDSWRVLLANGGFTNNNPPSVSDPNTWVMEIDQPSVPPIWWALIAW